MRPGPVGARGLAFVALALAVGVSHLQLGGWVADLGPDLHARAAEPERLKADFVFELRPAAPAPVGALSMAPGPSRSMPVAVPAPPAASAARLVAPEETADPTPPAAEPPPEAADEPHVVADGTGAEPSSSPDPAAEPDLAHAPAPGDPQVAPEAPSPVAAAAASNPANTTTALPPFEWPRSTRLSYRLTGNFRGPIDGQASVEWLREGPRYQVHVEVSVGPWFAPLLSRRLSSDGEIGPEGLVPRRYDEVTRFALRDPRRLTMTFDDSVVRLAGGAELPRPPGVQDTASQFVQLTWLFTTQPERLRSGQSVQLMLALPRRVDPWVYDVLDSERLYTSAGEIDAVHVRPRPLPRPSGELTAEVWIAPELQYLPVRIVIRQDADTYVDLLLERLPQQAAPQAPR